MADICLLEDVKADLSIDPTDTSQDDLLSRYIRSVTGLIERKTKRFFTITTATRMFDGHDRGYVIVDDFQSISQVNLLNPDQTVWKTFLPTELVYEPYNTLPKNKITIMNKASENPYRVIGRSPYIFPRGLSNVQITGLWGSFVTIPDELQELGNNLVKAKWAKRRTRGIRSASIGGESVSFTDNDLDQTMQDVINTWKRDYTEVW